MVFFIEFLKKHNTITDILSFCYNAFHGNQGFLHFVLWGNGNIKGVFLKNCKINVNGKNAKLCIGRRTQMHNCQIILTGDDSSLTIEGVSTNINNTSFVMAERGSCISIGKEFTMEGGYIRSIEGAEIKIGSDCMFSSDIDIASGDYHTIMDNDSKERINPSKEILISNHVWLGGHSKVLKGAVIPNGCIIGNCALVTGQLTESHAIYAGIPARLIKKNVDWSRERNI